MKRKNLLFILIMTVVILGNSLILTFSAVNINNWRINKAGSLYLSSLDSNNSEDRLILLIQSDLLSPDEEKKIEIADIYLKSSDFNKAKQYLERVNSQEGYLKYAESALEQKEKEIANEYISRLKNLEMRHELEIFSKITDNENNVGKMTELPISPQTNLGVILMAINTGDYSRVSDKTILGQKILEVQHSKAGNLSRDLEVANILIANNQPVLARIVLNPLIKEHPSLSDLYILKAASYIGENNATEALKNQLLAVNSNPSNVSFYKTALKYAQASGNQTEITWLTDNIKYLETIQSKVYCSTCGI